MRLFSPAKVNLFLRVLSRREDGYHELASLFQAVDLGDVLDISLASENSLTCTDPSLPCGPTNLISRAIDLFRKKTALDICVRVHLEKKVPIEAGIGGGSSNAATTLWALNELAGRVASEQELSAWAASIGSDISFFFSHGRAYCTGKGERVEPMQAMIKPPPLWLVKPPQGLSTPAIFKQLNLSQCSKIPPLELLKRHLDGEMIFHNDLELPAFEVMPALRTLKEELVAQGYEGVSMTGSGTGLLCLGERRPVVSPEIKCMPLKFMERPFNKWYEI